VQAKSTDTPLLFWYAVSTWARAGADVEGGPVAGAGAAEEPKPRSRSRSSREDACVHKHTWVKNVHKHNDRRAHL